MATALVLAGCQADEVVQVSPYTKSTAGAQKTRAPVSPVLSARMQTLNMDKNAPIMVRLFKEESKLEVWKQTRDGRYALLETFDICRWSGNLGPKVTEGDRQAPEGFYMITPGLMNPNSSYHLAFNIGFPNAYDRSLGRYGTNLMVHGACSSRGCYAMTDGQIEQIYALARDSFAGGQKAFQFQAYPFRMTPENVARHYDNPNTPFWAMLKEGYDHFEVTRQVPKVDVCGRKYVFDTKAANGAALSPAAACPQLVTAPDLAMAVASKQKRDQARVAELLPKMRSEREREADRARRVLLATAKGKVRSPTASVPQLANRRSVDGGGTAVMIAAAEGTSPPVYATSFSAPPGIEVAQVITSGPVPGAAAATQPAATVQPAVAPAVPAVAAVAAAGVATGEAAPAAPAQPAEVRLAGNNSDGAIVRPRVAEAGIIAPAPAAAAATETVAVASATPVSASPAAPVAGPVGAGLPVPRPGTELVAAPAVAEPVRTASAGGTSLLRGWFDGLFGRKNADAVPASAPEAAPPAAADVQVASAGEIVPSPAALPAGLSAGVLPEPRPLPGAAVRPVQAAAAPVAKAVTAPPVAAVSAPAVQPAVAASAPVPASVPAATAPSAVVVPPVPAGAAVPPPSAVAASADTSGGLRSTAQSPAADPAVKPTVAAGESVAVTSAAPRPSVSSPATPAPLVLDSAPKQADNKGNKSAFARAFDLFNE